LVSLGLVLCLMWLALNLISFDKLMPALLTKLGLYIFNFSRLSDIETK
jgi:hypothetical protein